MPRFLIVLLGSAIPQPSHPGVTLDPQRTKTVRRRKRRWSTSTEGALPSDSSSLFHHLPHISLEAPRRKVAYLWKLMKVLGEVYFKWVSVSGNAPEWRGCFHFRLQLKSTLVDRIIRDRSLIPPDHFIISQSHRLGTRHLQTTHLS